MNQSPFPMGGEPEDEITQLLRGSLHHEAQGVNPPDRFDDLLHAIDEADFAEQRPRRRGALWLVAAAAAVIALGVAAPFALPQVSRPDSAASQNQTAPTQPTQSAPASENPSLTTMQTGVPVFFVGRQNGLLYPESWDLITDQDRVTTAVSAAINRQPHDPNYTSLWSQGQVNSVTVRGNRIVIDLSGSVFKSWQTRDQAVTAINQVVYTAIANVGDAYGQKTVQILNDGQPTLPILGVPAADFTQVGMAPRALLWVKAPTYGATLAAGSVTISGYQQNTGSASVSWKISTAGANGTVVAQGSTTATPAQAAPWRQWQVVTDLPAGSYLLTVTASDNAKATETKAFQVR